METRKLSPQETLHQKTADQQNQPALTCVQEKTLSARDQFSFTLDISSRPNEK